MTWRKTLEVLALGETDRELERALAHVDELLSDPEKFEGWVDRVMDGWRKTRRSSRSSRGLKNP